MLTTDKPGRRGYLRQIGRKRLGLFDVYMYYRCNDCGHMYPDLTGFNGPSANGQRIKRCLCATPRSD